MYRKRVCIGFSILWLQAIHSRSPNYSPRIKKLFLVKFPLHVYNSKSGNTVREIEAEDRHKEMEYVPGKIMLHDRS
jgi:hypothetical protein